MKRLMILAVLVVMSAACSETPYMWTGESATALGSGRQNKYYKKTHKARFKTNRQLKSQYTKSF